MDDAHSANEPSTFQHTRNYDGGNILKPTFNKSTKNQIEASSSLASYKEVCGGGIARETLRKALEDKKNIQKGSDRKNNKLQNGKTFSSSTSSNKRSASVNSYKGKFDVFCEETCSSSSTVETPKPRTGMGGLSLKRETAEEQFERVDPDAQIEHFGCWTDDGEFYDSNEFRMTSPRNVAGKFQIDQIMRSVHSHKCDVMSNQSTDTGEGGLLEDEILEEDVLDIPSELK